MRFQTFFFLYLNIVFRITLKSTMIIRIIALTFNSEFQAEIFILALRNSKSRGGLNRYTFQSQLTCDCRTDLRNLCWTQADHLGKKGVFNPSIGSEQVCGILQSNVRTSGIRYGFIWIVGQNQGDVTCRLCGIQEETEAPEGVTTTLRRG